MANKRGKIELDVTYFPYFNQYRKNKHLQSKLKNMHTSLLKEEGNIDDNGVPMIGWKHLPLNISKQEIDGIQKEANKLAGKIDAFVSLGIGGSYLGLEAIIKSLTHQYHNELNSRSRYNRPAIYFMGQNMDSDYFHNTLEMLKNKRVAINVISKSGTTTETAVAFRIIKQVIKSLKGPQSKQYIVATTDKKKGALRHFANDIGCLTYDLPDNIGGRYSATSVVGLFGAQVAGIKIDELLSGAKYMEQSIRKLSTKPLKNPAFVRAGLRYLAHKRYKKDIEVVAANSEKLRSFTYWMEQLYPESEGKNNEGMWVAPSMYSEKAHANGQMVQSGKRNLIETFLRVLKPNHQIIIPKSAKNLDGLNFLAGKKLQFINDKVIDGLEYAHYKGNVPSMTIRIPQINAYTIGQFMQLEMNACALSGLLLNQNPFIQPGVERYKNAMFALSGKSGYEKIKKDIEKSRPKKKQIIK